MTFEFLPSANFLGLPEEYSTLGYQWRARAAGAL